MSAELHISLPLPDPLAFLDATVLFVIQLLIAKHPELLDAPDEASPSSASFLRAATHPHLLFTAVRELQYAIEVYRACLPARAAALGADDFPF
jgi:hypothetical protein